MERRRREVPPAEPEPCARCMGALAGDVPFTGSFAFQGASGRAATAPRARHQRATRIPFCSHPLGAEGPAWRQRSKPFGCARLFLSDVHLGTRGCQAELLLDFLRHYDADVIYLVGDIIDGWRLRSGWYWPQAHNDVVQKLLRKVRKGARLIYVPGQPRRVPARLRRREFRRHRARGPGRARGGGREALPGDPRRPVRHRRAPRQVASPSWATGPTRWPCSSTPISTSCAAGSA